jgi:hypothetical protein
MKRSQFREEQLIAILKEHVVGEHASASAEA